MLRILKVLPAILLSLVTFWAHASVIEYVGEAKHQDTGELLYRESHQLIMKDGQPLQRRVLYTDAQGQQFARKDNQYGDDPVTPDFTLDDERLPYQESVSRDGQRWRVNYREPGEKDKSTLKKPDYRPVIDAGFDEFVREQWPKLINGKSVSFSFAVASRLEWIDFRLIPLSQKDGVLEVEMRLKSRLLSWLLDPVRLSYEISSQRLLRYRGLTNIRAADGEGIRADIRYIYPQE